ncbi:hypothetical protein [Nonomuraea rosea]|uniref:hypothetical protein n=1 Tax=Nonomuraea rosea TaxID=638574 RepID=UPI0031EE5760
MINKRRLYGHPARVADRQPGRGSGKDSDADNYQYYAGPVYVSAPGQCIDVEGISPAWTSVKLNNVHCG